MINFKLLTHDESGVPVAGVLVGEKVFGAVDLLQDTGIDASSVLALLEDWPRAERALLKAVEALDTKKSCPVSEIKFLAPVLFPGAIYCAAANYRDHMRAMAVRLNQADEPDPHELNIKPFHFVVPGRSCTAGPVDPIRMPKHGENIDWEIELVAVIGKPARNVSIEDALDYVAAYTVGNDVSVRDMRYLKIPNVSQESLFRVDFIGGKGFDKSCVMGPWLVPARFIEDPQKLKLKTWVNDELMQDSSTSEMVFNTAEQISYLSQRVTLLPGDVVMTGTPAGTGMERDRFLRAGETIRMYIEDVGEITQKVIA